MAKNGLICAVLMFTVIGFAAAETGKVYTVDSVIRVHSPQGFICRINNYSTVGTVRLYVTIKGINPVEKELSATAETFLKKILKEGKIIQLKNIESGSYFRVKADVEVDGLDLAQSMIVGKLTTAAAPETVKQNLPNNPRPITRRPARSRTSNTAGSPKGATLSNPGPYKTIRLSELMNQIVDLSAWHEDMEFSEALEILQTSTNPELPLVVMWRDLEVNGFVDKTVPIGLEGLKLVPVKKAMQLLLLSVAEGRDELVCVPEGGVLTIATKQMGLGDKMVTRVYDTSELTAAQAAGLMGGLGMGGFGSNNMGMGNMGMGNMGMGNMGMGMGNMGMGNMGMGNMGFGNMGFGNTGFGNGSFGNTGFGNRSRNRY